MEILRERPENMSYEDYKTHLKGQKNWIKRHKQGKLYYISSDMFYSPEDTNKLFGLRETFPPFVGNTKDLINPV